MPTIAILPKRCDVICRLNTLGPTFVAFIMVTFLSSGVSRSTINSACAQTPAPGSFAIETIGGTAAPANNGDDGKALESNIGDPFGVEIGPDGALYVCEVRNHRIRRIDLQSGAIETIAGNGEAGYRGDGGPATSASMNEPYELRFDQDGHLFVVEMQNHVVRRIDAEDGTITTVAGTGIRGYGGDGGPAIEAKLNRPHSITLGEENELFIADIGNHRIRRVDLSTGMIESIAGSEERRLPKDGQIAKDNSILGPRALFYRDDQLWIALREGHSVWRLDLAKGVLHHVAGTGERGFSGDRGPALEATFNGPKGLALDADQNVYVVDTENHAIRRISPAGTIDTIAGDAPARGGQGDGGRAIDARLDRPHGVCVDDQGFIYIGDTLNHRVRRVWAKQD